MNFDLNLAKASAEAASQAYVSATVNSGLAHVLIVELPNVRLGMFRGTYCPLDWFTDAKVRFVEYPKGSGLMVHSGFNESMLSVRDGLMSTLKALPPKPTIIGGHSKGAGEARQLVSGLTPADIAAIDYVGSYTQGEPRSLSRPAALAYDLRFRETTFRLVHEEDFVARIPWMLGKYRHAGQEVLLSSFGACEVNPSTLALLLSDGFGLFKAWQAGKAIGLTDEALKDHYIANYIAALNAVPLGTISGVLTQA